MRTYTIKRTTNETDISLEINLDGQGRSEIATGCGFLDHILTLFAAHSGFDLSLTCKGDTEVDYHHTTEDIGICLGKAFSEALGDKKGICRYGDIMLPMDEALILCAADISGRAYLSYEIPFQTEKIGDFDTELVREFFEAFVRSSGVTLHLRKISGANSHHIAEGAFKAFARTLRKAAAADPAFADRVPSTKGVL